VAARERSDRVAGGRHWWGALLRRQKMREKVCVKMRNSIISIVSQYTVRIVADTEIKYLYLSQQNLYYNEK
jgi:hypothetical protein